MREAQIKGSIMGSGPDNADNVSVIEAALLFLAFAALGIYQAAPSVTTGDAGELSAAASVWGVAHAPGYATWTVLAKAFGTALPLGDWAYRSNLFSAMCGAAALVLLCGALRRFGAARAARLGAVVILGLSPLWREQSAVAEVFALLALCGAGLLWIVAAAGDRLLMPGPAAALGLVFGLGLGAHQTLALILPALIVAGLDKKGSWPRALAWAAFGTACGFAIHFAIPLRAFKSPPVDWDHATTFAAFKRLLLRRDYGTFALTVEGAGAFGLGELFSQLVRFFRAVINAFGPAGVILAAVGALGWSRSGLKMKARVAAAWIFTAGPLFLFMGRPGFDAQTTGALDRFYLLPLLGFVPFLASGLSLLGARVPAFAAFAAVMAAVSMIPEALNASRRDDYLAYDYGRSILRSLPRDAVLVMDGGDDTFYSLSFLTFASGLRPDVELRDRGGVVFPGGYGPDFRSLTKPEKDARRQAVESRWLSSGRLWYSTLHEEILPGASLAPAGLLRRPTPPKALFVQGPALRETLAVRWSRAAGARYRDRALAAFIPYQRGVEALDRDDVPSGASWLESASLTAPDALWVAPSASYLLGVKGFRAVERKNYPAAIRLYTAAANLEPDKAEPMSNLGVALERSGQPAEAERAFREAIRREPRSARAWSSLGARLWADKKWTDSADSFSSAAAIDPNDKAAANFAAQARFRANQK
jgi:tetratricopeptide (TPR) repeat protein